MKYRKMCRYAVVLTLFATCLFGSSAAWAAGNVRNTGFRNSTIRDDTLLQQGRFEVMVQSGGMFSSDSGGTDDSSTTETSSLYINPQVAVGYMVLDKVQLRLNAGWLKVSTSVDDNDLQDLNAGLGTLQGLYHIELPYGSAVYAGPGFGYFLGSTARPGPSDGSTVSNSTSGVVLQGIAGWLLQPGPRFILRAGLRLDTTFASEQPQDEGAEAIDTTNVKMMGEFGIGLRF